jgi:ABC-type tungstate transport system permease subunit
MSAARVSRAQQQRARLKIVQAQLKEAVESDHDEFLAHAAQIEDTYLDATAARKKFVKDFLAVDPKERPAQVNEVAAAMGLSTKRLYQIKDLK